MFKHRMNPLAALILIPALFSMEWYFLLFIVAVFAIVQYRFFYTYFWKKRELLFDAYIDGQSSIIKFRPYTTFVTIEATAFTLVFSFFTAVSIFSIGRWGLLSILIGCFFGLFVGEYISKKILVHAREHFRELYTLRWIIGFAVIGGLLAYIIFDLVSGYITDYSKLSPLEMSDAVVTNIEHRVSWLQNLARTLEYIHMKKRQLRDFLRLEEGSVWGGWLAYMYMIIPGTFSIYGMITTMLGTTELMNRLGRLRK